MNPLWRKAIFHNPEIELLEILRPDFEPVFESLSRSPECAGLDLSGSHIRFLETALPLFRKTLIWESHKGLSGSLEGLKRSYPVLANAWSVRLAAYPDRVLEILERLRRDLEVLRTDGLIRSGELAELTLYHGDLHHGFESVSLLQFRDGEKLVYKPRSLNLDRGFARLCQRLNRELCGEVLRAPRVVSRDRYGWMEFIKAKPCATEAEVSQFYHGFGAQLGLMFMLASVDIHYENLIAAGHTPVLVDLESLLQPMRHRRFESQGVESTAMLPTRIWGRGSRKGVDVGALSQKSGEVTDMWQEVARKDSAGRWTIVREPAKTGAGRHRPLLAGQELSPFSFQREIESGFTRIYFLILKLRARPGFADEILCLLEGCHTRVIYRPTLYYTDFINAVFDPRLLSCPSRFAEALNRLDVGGPEIGLSAARIEEEKAAVQMGLIPRFVLAVNDGEGLKLSPLQNVRYRVEKKFSARDYQRQIWFIKNSLLAADPAAAAGGQAHRTSLPRRETVMTGDQLVELCRGVKNEIMALGAYGQPSLWLTVREAEAHSGTIVFAAMGADFWDGLEGLGYVLKLYHERLGLEAEDMALFEQLPKSSKPEQLLFTAQAHGLDPSSHDYGENGLGMAFDPLLLPQSVADFRFSQPRGIPTPTLRRGWAGALHLLLRVLDPSIPPLVNAEKVGEVENQYV